MYLPANFNTMKKQNKSFASRARQLEARYKRLAFDPIEQKEFESEMEKLQAEQEQVREMMGMNQQEQPMQEFGTGGKMMMDGTNFTQFLPQEPYKFTPIGIQDILTKNKFDSYLKPDADEPLTLDSVKPIASSLNMATERELMKDNNKHGFLAKNKDILPYAISGASNIAGNLLMAAMAKKNQQRINPVLASPEQMNMEPQAEQFRKDASVSKNIGMKQARDLGMNAGATLANMGAIGSGVDRQLADTLTKLYGQQEQYNTGTANQFALQNQDASNRANLMNAQFGNQANQDRMGFLDDAIGTIPGVMKDVRMDKADKEMRDALNAQALNSGGRNYYAKGDKVLVGAKVFVSRGSPSLYWLELNILAYSGLSTKELLLVLYSSLSAGVNPPESNIILPPLPNSCIGCSCWFIPIIVRTCSCSNWSFSISDSNSFCSIGSKAKRL